ncbi:MAG: hypothetical protein ACJAWT_001217 [Glaciecola sp.]|jgi:hypothetical protein
MLIILGILFFMTAALSFDVLYRSVLRNDSRQYLQPLTLGSFSWLLYSKAHGFLKLKIRLYRDHQSSSDFKRDNNE